MRHAPERPWPIVDTLPKLKPNPKGADADAAPWKVNRPQLALHRIILWKNGLCEIARRIDLLFS